MAQPLTNDPFSIALPTVCCAALYQPMNTSSSSPHGGGRPHFLSSLLLTAKKQSGHGGSSPLAWFLSPKTKWRGRKRDRRSSGNTLMMNGIKTVDSHPKASPGPGAYTLPSSCLDVGGGRFNDARPKTALEQVIHLAKEVPASNHYVLPEVRASTPMNLAGKFSEACPKSDVEWRIFRAAQVRRRRASIAGDDLLHDALQQAISHKRPPLATRHTTQHLPHLLVTSLAVYEQLHAQPIRLGIGCVVSLCTKLTCVPLFSLPLLSFIFPPSDPWAQRLPRAADQVDQRGRRGEVQREQAEDAATVDRVACRRRSVTTGLPGAEAARGGGRSVQRGAAKKRRGVEDHAGQGGPGPWRV